MTYYLEKAPSNKKIIESTNFNVQQLNVILVLMRQCWKLRTGSIINNLLEASLPDRFTIESHLKKGRDDKEYKIFTVIEKSQ